MKKRLQLSIDLKTLIATLVNDPSLRVEIEEQLKCPPWPTNEPVGEINFGHKDRPNVYTLYFLENSTKKSGEEGYIQHTREHVLLELVPPSKDQRATLGQVLGKKKGSVNNTVPTVEELADRNVN